MEQFCIYGKRVFKITIENLHYVKVIEPIELTKEWEDKCKVKRWTIQGETKERRVIANITIPSYIEYVHELQNWYYWEFNKQQLKLEI